MRGKAIEILKAFSSDELKIFKNFIGSPYYNKNSAVITLFEILRKYHPAFEHKQLTNELVYKKLYGQKLYNDSVLKNLMSELYKLLKEFLMAEGYKKDFVIRKIFLLSELNAKNLDNSFEVELKDAYDTLEKTPVDWDYYMYYYHMESFKTAFYYFRHQDRKIADSLISKNNFFITFFLCNLPFLARNTRAYFNTYDVEKNVPSSIENFIECFDYDSFFKKFNPSPVFEIHYRWMMLEKGSDDEIHYKRFRQLFEENFQLFGQNYVQNFIHVLTDYYNRKEKDKPEFRKELFDLQKFILENKLYKYYEHSSFPLITFKYIVMLSISLGETDWAEDFIKKYSDEVEESVKANTVLLGYAFINFAKGKYGKTLEDVMKIKNDSALFRMDIKMLEIMCYYELGEYEMFRNSVELFRKFLPGYSGAYAATKEGLRNIVNAASQLMKIKENMEAKFPYDDYMLETADKEITQEGKIRFYSDWVRNKRSELMQKL